MLPDHAPVSMAGLLATARFSRILSPYSLKPPEEVVAAKAPGDWPALAGSFAAAMSTKSLAWLKLKASKMSLMSGKSRRLREHQQLFAQEW
jgi:hypothetical protein